MPSQGRAGAFVLALQGSYTAVVGLPLYETVALLEGSACAGHEACGAPGSTSAPGEARGVVHPRRPARAAVDRTER